MKRVVILGPGASGKSTLALRLAEITGLPVIELDKVFWQPGVVPMSRERIDFWFWLISYRYRNRPFLMKMILKHAPLARRYVLKSSSEVAHFLEDMERQPRE